MNIRRIYFDLSVSWRCCLHSLSVVSHVSSASSCHFLSRTGDFLSEPCWCLPKLLINGGRDRQQACRPWPCQRRCVNTSTAGWVWTSGDMVSTWVQMVKNKRFHLTSWFWWFDLVFYVIYISSTCDRLQTTKVLLTLVLQEHMNVLVIVY